MGHGEGCREHGGGGCVCVCDREGPRLAGSTRMGGGGRGGNSGRTLKGQGCSRAGDGGCPGGWGTHPCPCLPHRSGCCSHASLFRPYIPLAQPRRSPGVPRAVWPAQSARRSTRGDPAAAGPPPCGAGTLPAPGAGPCCAPGGRPPPPPTPPPTPSSPGRSHHRQALRGDRQRPAQMRHPPTRGATPRAVGAKGPCPPPFPNGLALGRRVVDSPAGP